MKIDLNGGVSHKFIVDVTNLGRSRQVVDYCPCSTAGPFREFRVQVRHGAIA